MPRIKLLLRVCERKRAIIIKQFHLGFTLIEFLVVLGLLAIAVGSSLLFLTSTLRGTNQANVTAEVKQNGQAVLDVLDSQIRNGRDARLLVGGELPSGSSNAIAVTLADGTYLYIACFDTVPGSSNGWIGVVPSTSASPPTPGTFAQNQSTNVDKVSGVDIDCSAPGPTFSVTPASTGTLSPAIVSVIFAASQGVNAPSRQDFKANVQFTTTISLRRY